MAELIPLFLTSNAETLQAMASGWLPDALPLDADGLPDFPDLPELGA